MKTRLHQKHVVNGLTKIKRFRKDFSRDCQRKLILTIAAFLLCFALAVCSSIYISPYTIYFFTPAIAGIFARQFFLRWADYQLLKELSKDFSDYAVWMENQLSKGNSRKKEHLAQAIAAYEKFSPHLPHNGAVIAQQLNEQMQLHTDNQILMSVLSGLLFSCGDSQHRDLLFRAKYKTGAAGNMILRDWIFCWDTSISTASAAKLKDDFLQFWDRKCRERS